MRTYLLIAALFCGVLYGILARTADYLQAAGRANSRAAEEEVSQF